MECRIIEPNPPIKDNNTCRICGKNKPRKEFRRVWKLRHLKVKEMRVWCKSCQVLWAESRTHSQFPPAEFVVLLE